MYCLRSELEPLRQQTLPQVVAIANDITYNSGAFGPKEDAMFRAATEYALQHHIPVFYLAANSGARVGLANEVKQCLKVEWHNPEEPQKGFKYLYLSDDDYHSITGVRSYVMSCRVVSCLVMSCVSCLYLCLTYTVSVYTCVSVNDSTCVLGSVSVCLSILQEIYGCCPISKCCHFWSPYHPALSLEPKSITTCCCPIVLCRQHCYPPAYSAYSCRLLHNTQIPMKP